MFCIAQDPMNPTRKTNMRNALETKGEALARRGFLMKAGWFSAGVMGWSAGASAFGTEVRKGPRISYFRDGEIYVTEAGKPEGKPLTTGHMDFKPSWSKTGDKLVCFRRHNDDPDVAKWLTSIFIMNVDGSGLHLLTDGTRTDFNPTWSRDGKNIPIWSRRNLKGGGYHVMQGRIGGKPGEELALTDEGFHTWAHSCLMDGRIFVNSTHPIQGRGVYLLSGDGKGAPRYERVHCELSATGQLHRASISPSEKKICFEYLPGFTFTEPGHTLYVADFDTEKRTITNLKVIANAEGKRVWYAYPRWINGESAVVYHLNDSGKGRLYVYDLSDGSTTCVSTEKGADYRYPHGEAAPC
jgi:Tol biopolymer transport system component